MAQTRKQSEDKRLIRLRVVESKYMESHEGGKAAFVVAPWPDNKVLVSGKTYKSGKTFSVDKKTAKELLLTGGVQLASEKPKPFFPPFLEHKLQFCNGIAPRDELLGLIPTRDVVTNDYESGWKPKRER